MQRFYPFKQEEFLKTIRKALPYSDCPNGFTVLRTMIFAPQIIFSPCFDCLLQAEPVKTLSEMVFSAITKKEVPPPAEPKMVPLKIRDYVNQKLQYTLL